MPGQYGSMELRHLRSFVAVAEEASFTNAAALLGIAQPSLSRQIRRLEQSLGVELFHRVGRGVVLSTAGEALLRPARELLADAERAARAARHAAVGTSGRLRVGALSYNVPDLPTRLLGRFGEVAPDVELVPFFGSTGQRLALLRSRELDVAFVRLAHLDDQRLDFRRLLVEPLHLALPAHHPLAAGTEVALTQLGTDDLAFYVREQNPLWYDEVLALLRSAGVRPRTIREGWSVMDALPLVAAEEAVAFISDTMVRLLRYPGVVYRPLALPAPILGLGIAWHAGNPSPALGKFLAHTAD
jgi:DNA-binding transcriptional LysR family regulator